tara:strand:- start:119 stop:283 length:165 start_codon:yes stop_codon:yes gene_type:complete
MKIFIEEQRQFGNWVQFSTKHNEADAYRVASRRASSTGKRMRLIDETGRVVDIL